MQKRSGIEAYLCVITKTGRSGAVARQPDNSSSGRDYHGMKRMTSEPKM